MERGKQSNITIILSLMLIVVFLFCGIIFTGCSGQEVEESGIKIESQFKTEYYIGEEIDVSGGIIDYTENGKTEKVDITTDMISDFSSQTTGTRPLLITYKNYSITLNYTIKNFPEFFTSGIYRSTKMLTYNEADCYIALNVYTDKQLILIDISANSKEDILLIDWSSDNVMSVSYTPIFKNDEWTADGFFVMNDGNSVVIKIKNINSDSFKINSYSIEWVIDFDVVKI